MSRQCSIVRAARSKPRFAVDAATRGFAPHFPPDTRRWASRTPRLRVQEKLIGGDTVIRGVLAFVFALTMLSNPMHFCDADSADKIAVVYWS